MINQDPWASAFAVMHFMSRLLDDKAKHAKQSESEDTMNMSIVVRMP